jgi:hypothetical protein
MLCISLAVGAAPLRLSSHHRHGAARSSGLGCGTTCALTSTIDGLAGTPQYVFSSHNHSYIVTSSLGPRTGWSVQIPALAHPLAWPDSCTLTGQLLACGALPLSQLTIVFRLQLPDAEQAFPIVGTFVASIGSACDASQTLKVLSFCSCHYCCCS